MSCVGSQVQGDAVQVEARLDVRVGSLSAAEDDDKVVDTSAGVQGVGKPAGASAASSTGESPDDKPLGAPKRRRNALVLLIVAALWFVFDFATKRYFSTFEAGQTVSDGIPGIFRFHLVHNTGAAWGIFSNMTVVLGVLALVVCVLLLVYLFVLAPRSSAGAAFGIALVVAGGVGNAIDRFLYGYVTDFIDLTFIDFPVFNIADMGVTCGIVIFLVAFIVDWIRAS